MPAETETTSHYVLTQFESIGDELRKLRERDTNATAQIRDLEKKLSHAEQWVRRLREKCDVLEKKPVVLDGEDEKWLFDHRATVTFGRRLDGHRKVRIVDHGGREKALVLDSEQRPKNNMLRLALNEASGRERK